MSRVTWRCHTCQLIKREKLTCTLRIPDGITPKGCPAGRHGWNWIMTGRVAAGPDPVTQSQDGQQTHLSEVMERQAEWNEKRNDELWR